MHIIHVQCVPKLFQSVDFWLSYWKNNDGRFLRHCVNAADCCWRCTFRTLVGVDPTTTAGLQLNRLVIWTCVCPRNRVQIVHLVAKMVEEALSRSVQSTKTLQSIPNSTVIWGPYGFYLSVAPIWVPDSSHFLQTTNCIIRQNVSKRSVTWKCQYLRRITRLKYCNTTMKTI